LGTQAGVVEMGAGEDDDLEASVGGEVEDSLEADDAVGVAVREGVVKDE